MTGELDLLAIGAHPDDVEMTSGGWLCLARHQGYRTGVVHLTRGEMGTHGTAEERVAEAAAAAEIMGCETLEFADLPDGHVRDDEPSIAKLIALVRRLRPRIVVAPYFRCHHPDHEAAARLVEKAVHLAALRGYHDGHERHTTHRLVHARYSQYFEPSFYVDVSAVIEQKQRAILAYRSQVEASVPKDGSEPVTRLSRPGFTDQILSVTASQGLKAGCDHAEVYFMRTGPIVSDPVRWLAEGPMQHLIR